MVVPQHIPEVKPLFTLLVLRRGTGFFPSLLQSHSLRRVRIFSLRPEVKFPVPHLSKRSSVSNSSTNSRIYSNRRHRRATTATSATPPQQKAVVRKERTRVKPKRSRQHASIAVNPVTSRRIVSRRRRKVQHQHQPTQAQNRR